MVEEYYICFDPKYNLSKKIQSFGPKTIYQKKTIRLLYEPKPKVWGLGYRMGRC